MSLFEYVESMEKAEALSVVEDYRIFRTTGTVTEGTALAHALESSGIHRNFWVINTHALLAEIAARFVTHADR